MGALMLSMDCTHPDLEEFINLKSDPDKCTKANISVKVSDAFMKAVEQDQEWMLSFKNGSEHIVKYVKAREIFNLLAKRNWESAEPGVLFWDNICNNNMLNTDHKFSYAGTNPCAEEPLPAGGSCLLGSINLSEFVVNPFTERAYFNFAALQYTVANAVKALNQVLLEGMKLHPLKEQQDSVYDWRQIGLGTMGLGDMLIKMGVKYGSPESIKLIDNVMHDIAVDAVETSLELAKNEGCYPVCDKESLITSSFIKNLCLSQSILDDIKEYGLFNSQLLTCAPTGSIGTMLQISTGVEPNFAFQFNRRTQSLHGEDVTYKVDAKILEDFKKINVSGEIPSYFVSSQEIDPFDRIKVQATLQKYIDASISSTINLPESTTVEEVANIYYAAWENGLKGITIYRDNCQRQGILTTDKNDGAETLSPIYVEGLQRGEIIKADDNCIGLKRTLVTGCGTLHCEAFFDPITGELRETYLSKGSKGGCNNFMIGLSRMISLAARGGLSIDAILDQLKSCGTCPSYAVRHAVKGDTSIGSCCPVAVGNALKDMHNEVLKRIKCCPSDVSEKLNISKDELEELRFIHELNDDYEECPKCHHKTLIHHGGCVSCTDCGWTKCD